MRTVLVVGVLWLAVEVGLVGILWLGVGLGVGEIVCVGEGMRLELLVGLVVGF